MVLQIIKFLDMRYEDERSEPNGNKHFTNFSAFTFFTNAICYRCSQIYELYHVL